jgi:transposase
MEGRRVRIVGVDCAGETHVAVLLSEDGRLERRWEMTNRRDGIEACLAEVMLCAGENAEIVLVLESARSYGRLVADVARQLGFELHQVGTVALNRFRAVEGQPRKSDVWDAFLAARMEFLGARGVRRVPQVSDSERTLSRLTRAHRRLKKDRTRKVMQLEALLLELAPEVLHSSWEGPKPNSKGMLYLLKRWPGFEGLERAHLSSIEKVLHRCRYGAKATPVGRLIREMARRIMMPAEERTALTFEMSVLVEGIGTCDASLNGLDKEIARRVKSDVVGAKLLALPGIGPVRGGVLVSELLPVARVATEAQAATYSGVTPLGRTSGKTMDRSHLSEGVNKRILEALYESSVASIKHSAINQAYYKKKLKDYAGHPKPTVAALIALSRQRHKLIYKLMTTDAIYDGEILVARHLERLQAGEDAEAAA